jgi:multiple sugar transport system substrate-binding protein
VLSTANAEADRRILEEVYEPVDPAFDEAVQLLVDVQDDAFALPASPAGADFDSALADAVNRVLTGRRHRRRRCSRPSARRRKRSTRQTPDNVASPRAAVG